MKRFIGSILLFLALVLIADLAFGKICSYLQDNAIGGMTKHYNYIAKECDEDLLIFGTSRAANHFVPSVLEDIVNIPAYNCGEPGGTIFLSYARLRMACNRYTPKVAILEIMSDYDIWPGSNQKSIKILNEYTDIEGITEILNDIDNENNIKRISNFYRYNTNCLTLLKDNRPNHSVPEQGYQKVSGKMDYEPEPKIQKILTENDWDSVKRIYLDKFRHLCDEKGIKFCIMISPYYKAESSYNRYHLIHQYCKKHRIPILDYYAYPEICNNREYFHDPYHMNHEGATIFTQKVAAEIKRIFNL